MKNLRSLWVLAVAVLAISSTCEKSAKPVTPGAPDGPTAGETGGYYGFTTSSTSTKDDSVHIVFDWNDGYSDTVALQANGTQVSESHAWVDTGTFAVKALAMDMEGAASDWSAAHQIVISLSATRPPNRPNAPDGPTEGSRQSPYTFNAVTTDPEGESLSYRFDWDYAREVSEWIGYVASGEPVTYQHSWNRNGTYDIRVQVKDTDGHFSAWSSPHPLTIH
jgi:hypothetical protein